MPRRKPFSLRRVVEEIVFGVEDSLVSTLGALTGIAVGTQSSYVVLVSGLVLIAAESLSMTAGSYLSSKSEGEVWLNDHADDWDTLMQATSMSRGPIGAALRREQVTGERRRAVLEAVEVQRKRWLQQVIAHERASSPAGSKTPVLAALVMGVSYVSAGAVPLLPYVFLPIQQAIWPSILVTAVALFVFGMWKASFTRQSRVRSGAEMVLVASCATAAAYGLGVLARVVFDVML